MQCALGSRWQVGELANRARVSAAQRPTSCAPNEPKEREEEAEDEVAVNSIISSSTGCRERLEGAAVSLPRCAMLLPPTPARGEWRYVVVAGEQRRRNDSVVSVVKR